MRRTTPPQSNNISSWVDTLLIDELRENITAVIQARESLRDDELERLEKQTQTLLHKLDRLERRKLREELACFKDILALHKRARADHG